MRTTSLFLLAGLALGTFGCSTTMRSLSAEAWVAPPGSEAKTSGMAHNYYLTYWEGNCKPVLGCGAGTTKVKRCNVAEDNSMTCVDEEEATKAFNPE